MTQAAIHNIRSIPNCATAQPDRFDLEGDLSDLAQMARLAQLTASATLLCDDPASDDIDRAMFAVAHIGDMIKALQRKYID